MSRSQPVIVGPMVQVTRPPRIDDGGWRPARSAPVVGNCPPDRPPPVIVPPISTPPANQGPDLSAILTRLDRLQAQVEALAANRPRDGRDGVDGIAPSADAIAVAIAGKVKACECGPVKPPPSPVAHFVVVTDDTTPDYRLTESIRAAQKTYSGIKVAGLPPFPIGTVPQVVEYRGATPYRTVKGTRDVEELLYRISRGEYPAG